MPLCVDDLRAFAQSRARPYDPTAEDYPSLALPRAICTTKQSAIYAMHSYHQGKKPHDALRQYIRHFSQPGELVLDPFCGSGGTALAAMLEGRTAIALDRSPAAVFIAQNYCTALDPLEVQRVAEELLAAAEQELHWLYATRCTRCDGPARTVYTVYSERFACPRCQEVLPLADCPKVLFESKAAKSQNRPVCRHCLASGQLEVISTRSLRHGAVPVLAAYRCLGGCRPAEDQRRHNDTDAKNRDYFSRYDLAKIEEIAASDIPHWLPITAFPPSFARWQTDLRPAGIESVADLYTKRNLWALAALRASAIRCSSPRTALFALTAISLAVSRMQRYSPASGFPNMLLVGTYYIPPIGREIEVGSWCEGKFRALVKGYTAICHAMPANAEGFVATSDARQLDLPDNSIDYIFTDPPYADAVQYGELNFVWESWLGGTPDWHESEIVVNRARGKTADDWAAALEKAMRECHRVLKPGRWLSLCYHDTSASRWAMLQDLMSNADFVVDSAAAAGSIETGQQSFNQWMTDKATKRDLVISFRKLRSGRPRQARQTIDFQAAARQFLCDYLTTHGSATADRLYDALVSHFVCRGELQSFDFESLLRSVAEADCDPEEEVGLPENRRSGGPAIRVWKMKQ